MNDREIMSLAGMGLGADQMVRVTTRMRRPGPKKIMTLCSPVLGSTLRVAVSFRGNKALQRRVCPACFNEGRGFHSAVNIPCSLFAEPIALQKLLVRRRKTWQQKPLAHISYL